MSETTTDKIARMKKWCSVCGKALKGKPVCDCEIEKKGERLWLETQTT